MKLFPSLLLVPLLLAGCGDDEALKAENGQLKDELAKAKRETTATAAKVKIAQGRVKELEALIATEEARANDLQAKLSATEAKARLAANTEPEESSELVTNSTRRMRNPVSADSAASADTTPREMTDEEKLAAYISGGIQGVPFNIAQEIINKAKTEKYAWRAVSEIEDEGKGYAELDTFSRSYTAMPTAVRDAIVAAAKRENPGDWSRMASDASKEAAAWKTIDDWKRTGIPGLTRQRSTEILNEALSRYPNDWSMVQFVAAEDAKKVE